jgi:hypothetical protein
MIVRGMDADVRLLEEGSHFLRMICVQAVSRRDTGLFLARSQWSF